MTVNPNEARNLEQKSSKSIVKNEIKQVISRNLIDTEEEIAQEI